MTNLDPKKYLAIKMNQLIEQISNINDVTIEESELAYNEVLSLLGKLETATEDMQKAMLDKIEALSEKATKYRLNREHERYSKAFKQDIVRVTKRYVITNERLVSPAGFHPNDLVFVVSEVFIQTNKLPRKLAKNHLLYDMEQMKAN